MNAQMKDRTGRLANAPIEEAVKQRVNEKGLTRKSVVQAMHSQHGEGEIGKVYCAFDHLMNWTPKSRNCRYWFNLFAGVLGWTSDEAEELFSRQLKACGRDARRTWHQDVTDRYGTHLHVVMLPIAGSGMGVMSYGYLAMHLRSIARSFNLNGCGNEISLQKRAEMARRALAQHEFARFIEEIVVVKRECDD